MTISARSRHSSPRGCHHRYTLTRIFAARRLPPSQMSINERDPVPASTTTSVNRQRLSAPRWPVWWPLALGAAVTIPLTLYWWSLVAAGSVAFDWRIFVQAGERFRAHSPDLYEVSGLYSFRHSPVMALVMPAVAWIGVIGIRLVTLASALAMPTWPMRLLTIASWPFAMDAQHGALITPIVLAAAWALKGSRTASVAFIILTLLSPRPLMLPIAAYLLWQQPWLRIPSVALFVAHAAAVLATGYAGDWLAMLSSQGTDPIAGPYNLSPTRFLGALWLPIGVALAVFLTWRGRVGWAGLAISPYVLPHYLLLLLLEIAPRAVRREPSRQSSAS